MNLLEKEELSEIEDVFNNGGVLFLNGLTNFGTTLLKSMTLKRIFAERMGTTNALAVSSGTAALRVALAMTSRLRKMLRYWCQVLHLLQPMRP